jgi:hypothetical protein
MATANQPLVRARFCQEWLTLVEKEEEPYRSRFFEALDSETRETIESAARVGWLPIELHVRLADVMQDTFGAVRAHSYYRRAFAGYATGPVLGPLMQTAARLLGISIPTFVRWASRAWESSFRNMGALVGEVVAADRARLTYRGLPAVCTASDGWMLSAQGSAYGAYDILGVAGVVRVDMSKRSEGEMVLDLEWTARRS